MRIEAFYCYNVHFWNFCNFFVVHSLGLLSIIPRPAHLYLTRCTHRLDFSALKPCPQALKPYAVRYKPVLYAVCGVLKPWPGVRCAVCMPPGGLFDIGVVSLKYCYSLQSVTHLTLVPGSVTWFTKGVSLCASWWDYLGRGLVFVPWIL